VIFDLVCRRCGAYGQSRWNPSHEVMVTACRACGNGMTVIGIDFPSTNQPVALDAVLQGVKDAGLIPLAVERQGRRRRTFAR
jgi:hypothetical protein